jgi:lysophospholipase L1-like esterase
MRRRIPVAAVVLAFTAVLLVPADALAQGPPPLPDSIAAIGDSISQAFDACCWYGNHPGSAWSTGGLPFDEVISHYERIRALHGAIRGHASNLAVAGATMADAPGQAAAAVAQRAEYVTIELGANDLCTTPRRSATWSDSPATMTPVASFRAQFQAAMTVLERGLPPGAHIFVASIPNLLQLRSVLHGNVLARLVWGLAGICGSLLAGDRSDAGRQAVAEREAQLNGVLGEVCGRYANCRFDQLAVYRYPFGSALVSKLDFFHPNLDGQAKLADITWAASWWA